MLIYLFISLKVMQKYQKCYCDRKINPNAPNASFFEEEYCSDYCRRYEAQGLEKINGAEKYDKKQYSGFNWMPVITIPCEMCETPMELRYEYERANRQFCSLDCHRKMKTTRKKAQINYAMLRLLRHRRNHCDSGWITAEEMNRYMRYCKYTKGSPRQIANLLRKWISRGVVDSEGKTQKQYRLKSEYLTGPLAKYYYEHDKSQLIQPC